SPEVAAEIHRLANLPDLDYDRERKSVAEKLGVRTQTLDEAVKKLRPSGPTDIGPQGRSLNLSDPEPWPEPVDGENLLNDLVNAINRYVIMDATSAHSVALWIIAVHAFPQFVVFPRLAIVSPEKQCGKTTLLDLLSHLVPKPLPASNVTPAA